MHSTSISKPKKIQKSVCLSLIFFPHRFSKKKKKNPLMHTSLSLTPSPLFHLHSQVAGQKKKEKERDQRIQLSYWNKEGWLEIMLNRQLVRDDGCGLGQELMDNRPMNESSTFLWNPTFPPLYARFPILFPWALLFSLIVLVLIWKKKKKFESALSHDSHLGSCLVDTKVSSHTIKKRKNCSIRSWVSYVDSW